MYGVGWIPDTRTHYDTQSYGTMGTTFGADFPNVHDKLANFVAIKQQSITNSCVGWAANGCIYTFNQVRGINVPFGSSRDVYTKTRIRMGRPLTDRGCFPFVAVSVMAEFGVASELDVPFDPALINDELSWESVQASASQKVTAWRRIPNDQNRIDELCRAVSVECPVMFGAQIDHSFDEYVERKSGVWNGCEQVPRGGHMMFVCGYSITDDFAIVANSWGTDLGIDGFVRISLTAMRNLGLFSDFYVLEGAPVIQ